MLKPALLALAILLTPAMSGPSIPAQTPWALNPAMVEAAPITHRGPPGAFIIAMGSPAEVDSACRGGLTVPQGYIALACARDDRRVVLMPHPCLYEHEYYAKLLCHEQAHLSRPGLRGWKH